MALHNGFIGYLRYVISDFSRAAAPRWVLKHFIGLSNASQKVLLFPCIIAGMAAKTDTTYKNLMTAIDYKVISVFKTLPIVI